MCLIHYEDGEKKYILHPIGAIIKDTIEVSIKIKIFCLNLSVI